MISLHQEEPRSMQSLDRIVRTDSQRSSTVNRQDTMLNLISMKSNLQIPISLDIKTWVSQLIWDQVRPTKSGSWKSKSPMWSQSVRSRSRQMPRQSSKPTRSLGSGRIKLSLHPMELDSMMWEPQVQSRMWGSWRIVWCPNPTTPREMRLLGPLMSSLTKKEAPPMTSHSRDHHLMRRL